MAEPQRVLLTVRDAADVTGLSDRAIYHAVARGELRAIRVCSRIRIPQEWFDEWLGRAVVEPEPAFVMPPCRCGRTASRHCSGRRALGDERREGGAKDGGVVWRVRWRQAGQNRAKVLGRKRDAEAFDAERKRRRRLGELGLLDAGNELADFGQDWWKLYAEPNLSKATLRVYAQLWDAHVLPRLGQLKLRELTVETLQRYRLELQRDGVGQASHSWPAPRTSQPESAQLAISSTSNAASRRASRLPTISGSGRDGRRSGRGSSGSPPLSLSVVLRLGARAAPGSAPSRYRRQHGGRFRG